MAPTQPQPRAASCRPPTVALPSAMVRNSAAAWCSVYSAGSSTTSSSLASRRLIFSTRHERLSLVYATR